MLNWYQQYDKETYKAPFARIDYSRYDPIAYSHVANSIYQSASPAQDHIVNQFKAYQKANKPQKVQDPMSQLCIEHQIRQLSMVYTMFETESLLSEADYDSKYRPYCSQVVHYTVVESFYIYTVCNLVQSADQRTFYRERVHHMFLRTMYLLADINMKVINDEFPGQLTVSSIHEMQDYLQELQKILLNQIVAYERINPLEIMIA